SARTVVSATSRYRATSRIPHAGSISISAVVVMCGDGPGPPKTASRSHQRSSSTGVEQHLYVSDTCRRGTFPQVRVCFTEIMDIFEGTEQIQQLVISRAISGLRIE